MNRISNPAIERHNLTTTMNSKGYFFKTACAVLAVTLACPGATAASAHVAVATNFLLPMQELKRAFEASTSHTLIISTGSTGQLHAQTLNGAPFDVFLAADQKRPLALAQTRLAEPDSQVTYALGRLALVARKPPFAKTDGLQTLSRKLYRHLAIAKPGIAPYGDAAMQVLNSVRQQHTYSGNRKSDEKEKRLVYAHSVGQAYAMTASGAADMALVAQSFLSQPHPPNWHWRVPQHLHKPIRQDAILTRRGTQNNAAGDFMSFLVSTRGQKIIASFGYGIP